MAPGARASSANQGQGTRSAPLPEETWYVDQQVRALLGAVGIRRFLYDNDSSVTCRLCMSHIPLHSVYERSHLMTALRQQMLEDLQLRNYAPNTHRCPLRCVADFAQRFHTPTRSLGTETRPRLSTLSRP